MIKSASVIRIAQSGHVHANNPVLPQAYTAAAWLARTCRLCMHRQGLGASTFILFRTRLRVLVINSA